HQIAESDKVVTRWRMRGTHRGEFGGIAPTGKKLDVTGIAIFRFSDEGKVVESWDNFDQLGMMRQLGVIPAPGGSRMSNLMLFTPERPHSSIAARRISRERSTKHGGPPRRPPGCAQGRVPR
ncbi:MAG TPA: ester cyclase, partial [Rubrobacter sp.]|nr:ester cyclase [Rubrobacter sp.]